MRQEAGDRRQESCLVVLSCPVLSCPVDAGAGRGYMQSVLIVGSGDVRRDS
jgi:hypothetical protein